MRANSTSQTSQASMTLSKAVIKAAELLHLKQLSVARILGLSTATASRLHAGTYLLSPERGKEWELALLFVRVFRSLDAVLGHGDAAKKWLSGNNLALNGRPAELMENTEGLIRVLHYLDAHRGRI
ncbi:MbcA/ParS/Xre antitoxin family protein [Oxalobacteraceae bacterium R-40]|uniref:MbcA/ParS/Xre antitoxin family protein n=1 Tax=Keguizhuia sedimenti TaxID=3064264 RepID=A0ABU1BNG1_9BURK|nr:MbcA/ParS/Xre antitoxin family protein [Oxalobacteraceae bacterium R-40]